MTGNGLLTAPSTALPSPHHRRVTPAATARLIALPDALRAWAREDPVARLHLGQHVTRGMPLGLALARIADALGEDGADEVRRRLLEGQRQPEHFRPFCSRPFDGGLRCRSLTTRLVQVVRDGRPSSAVERCDACAEAHEREGTGINLRAIARR